MLPERADEMLKDYKHWLARCEHLRAVIEALKADIETAEREGQEALITGKSASDLDGMPRGNAPGKPTERIAMMLVSGYTTADVTALHRELKRLTRELEEKEVVVTLVEAWLKGLTAKERWMVERQVFDEMTYREINAAYRQEFNETCSKDLLRRLKRSAMEKIYAIAN